MEETTTNAGKEAVPAEEGQATDWAAAVVADVGGLKRGRGGQRAGAGQMEQAGDGGGTVARPRPGYAGTDDDEYADCDADGHPDADCDADGYADAHAYAGSV